MAREQRTRHLRIRLTEAEHAALDAAAEAAERRVSDQARAMLFAAAPPATVTTPSEASEDLARAERHRELCRIGSNLNQIARQMNAAAGRRSTSVTRVLEVLEDLHAWVEIETAKRRRPAAAKTSR